MRIFKLKKTVWLAIGSTVLLVAGCAGTFVEYKCVEYSKVVEVESIFYRGGYVVLENGDRVKIGQPRRTITVGTEFCVKKEKVGN